MLFARSRAETENVSHRSINMVNMSCGIVETDKLLARPPHCRPTLADPFKIEMHNAE